MNYDKIDLLALRATDDKGGLDRHKFAELIVKECVEIAKDVNRNPYLDEHHHARQIIKNITKRFGVEE